MNIFDSHADSSMRPLPEPPLPADDARWALFLEVDGILPDLNDGPSAAPARVALLTLLHALHDALGGAMALVSNRGLDDVDRLFSKPRWAAAGLYGLQLRRADGSFRRMTSDAEQERLMHQTCTALAAKFTGVQLEDRQIVVALHCRHVPEHFDALRDAAREMMHRLPGYELQPGHLVITFKPAGMDKARAVRELLASTPFSGRQPVYLGDGLADEGAFTLVRKRRGASILTGAPRPTHAAFSLPGPVAVETWLIRVLAALSQDAIQRNERSTTRDARHP